MFMYRPLVVIYSASVEFTEPATALFPRSKTSHYRRQSWCCELNLGWKFVRHALPAYVLEGRSLRSIATVPRIIATILNESVVVGMFVLPRPLMGWSGRAPAPPASEAGKGHQRQGARHVSDSQYWNRRDRH